MKAIILAAGKGTRMYPLTQHIPKVLAPIYKKTNETLLERVLKQVKDAGIEKIGVVIGYKGNLVKNHLNEKGYSIKYFVQEKQRGNADAIWQAKKWLTGSDFLYVAGDGFFYENRIKDMKKKFEDEGVDGLIGVKKLYPPSKKGVTKHRNGKVTMLQRKSESFEEYRDASVMMFNKDFINYLRLHPFKNKGKDMWGLPEAVNDYAAHHNAEIFDIGKKMNVNTLSDLEKTIKILENESLNNIGSDIEIGDKNAYT